MAQRSARVASGITVTSRPGRTNPAPTGVPVHRLPSDAAAWTPADVPRPLPYDDVMREADGGGAAGGAATGGGERDAHAPGSDGAATAGAAAAPSGPSEHNGILDGLLGVVERTVVERDPAAPVAPSIPAGAMSLGGPLNRHRDGVPDTPVSAGTDQRGFPSVFSVDSVDTGPDKALGAAVTADPSSGGGSDGGAAGAAGAPVTGSRFRRSKKPSLFMAMRAKQQNATSPPTAPVTASQALPPGPARDADGAAAARASAPTVGLGADMGASAIDGSVSGMDLAEISRANAERLAGMTPAQIAEAQAEVSQIFDASMIAKIRARGLGGGSAASGSHAASPSATVAGSGTGPAASGTYGWPAGTGPGTVGLASRARLDARPPSLAAEGDYIDSDVRSDNARRVAGMSAPELAAAQAEIHEAFSPEAIAFMKKWAVQREAEASGHGAAGAGGVVGADAGGRGGGADGTGGTLSSEAANALTKVRTEAELDEAAAMYLSPVEKAKLEWTSAMPASAASGAPGTAAGGGALTAAAAAQEEKDPDELLRFDFKGRAVDADADIPVSEGLHHHGDNPTAAGYTLDELMGLSRSSAPSQRTTALGVVRAIGATRRAALVAGLEVAPKQVPPMLPIFLRASIDDANPTAVCAALAALEELVVASDDEVLRDWLEASYRGHESLPPVDCPQATNTALSHAMDPKRAAQVRLMRPAGEHSPELRFWTMPAGDGDDVGVTDIVEDAEGESDLEPEEPSAAMPRPGDDDEEGGVAGDAAAVLADPVRALVGRMKLLDRLTYIIDVLRPPVAAIDSCLRILTACARRSLTVASRVAAMPRLMEAVRRRCIESMATTTDFAASSTTGAGGGASAAGAGATDEAPSALPRTAALRLVRALCCAGRNVAWRLVRDGWMDSLKRFLRLGVAIAGETDAPAAAAELPVELLAVQGEVLRIWRVCIGYGLDTAAFTDLYPVLLSHPAMAADVWGTDDGAGDDEGTAVATRGPADARPATLLDVTRGVFWVMEALCHVSSDTADTHPEHVCRSHLSSVLPSIVAHVKAWARAGTSDESATGSSDDVAITSCAGGAALLHCLASYYTPSADKVKEPTLAGLIAAGAITVSSSGTGGVDDLTAIEVFTDTVLVPLLRGRLFRRVADAVVALGDGSTPGAATPRRDLAVVDWLHGVVRLSAALMRRHGAVIGPRLAEAGLHTSLHRAVAALDALTAARAVHDRRDVRLFPGRCYVGLRGPLLCTHDALLLLKSLAETTAAHVASAGFGGGSDAGAAAADAWDPVVVRVALAILPRWLPGDEAAVESLLHHVIIDPPALVAMGIGGAASGGHAAATDATSRALGLRARVLTYVHQLLGSSAVLGHSRALACRIPSLVQSLRLSRPRLRPSQRSKGASKRTAFEEALDVVGLPLPDNWVFWPLHHVPGVGDGLEGDELDDARNQHASLVAASLRLAELLCAGAVPDRRSLSQSQASMLDSSAPHAAAARLYHVLHVAQQHATVLLRKDIEANALRLLARFAADAGDRAAFSGVGRDADAAATGGGSETSGASGAGTAIETALGADAVYELTRHNCGSFAETSMGAALAVVCVAFSLRQDVRAVNREIVWRDVCGAGLPLDVAERARGCLDARALMTPRETDALVLQRVEAALSAGAGVVRPAMFDDDAERGDGNGGADGAASASAKPCELPYRLAVYTVASAIFGEALLGSAASGGAAGGGAAAASKAAATQKLGFSARNRLRRLLLHLPEATCFDLLCVRAAPRMLWLQGGHSAAWAPADLDALVVLPTGMPDAATCLIADDGAAARARATMAVVDAEPALKARLQRDCAAFAAAVAGAAGE